MQRAANQPGVCGQLSRATQPAVTTHHPCGQVSRATQPAVTTHHPCGQVSRATQPAVTTHHPCGQLSRATQPAVITVNCVVDVTAFCTGLRIHVILSTDPDLNFHFKDLIPTLFLKFLKLKLNEIDLNLY